MGLKKKHCREFAERALFVKHSKVAHQYPHTLLILLRNFVTQFRVLTQLAFKHFCVWTCDVFWHFILAITEIGVLATLEWEIIQKHAWQNLGGGGGGAVRSLKDAEQ
jgi:hypothetical protein